MSRMMEARAVVAAPAPPRTLFGWILMAAIAAAASLAADLGARALGAGSLLEPATLAILTGLTLRNTGWVPSACQAGIKHYELALKAGIVLLGLSLTFTQAVRLGARAVGVVLLCLATVPVLIYVLGRRFRIAAKLALLIGVGTTICGATAIAIAASAIDARDEEISYAVGTISLIGLLTMLVLPLTGTALGMSDAQFGLWAGTAVPATAQVIGAASIYSDGAVAHATIVKMTRNLFMIPAVFVIGIWYARQRSSVSGRRLSVNDGWKAVPAFLLGFVLLALIRSFVDHSGLVARDVWQQLLTTVAWVDKWLLLTAMAGIGLNTRFGALRTVGATPLLVGFVGATFLGVLSYVLIRASGFGG